MTTDKMAEEICAEIRIKFREADHFKNLWMQANSELERTNNKLSNARIALGQIEGIAGGSTTANSLPNLKKIAAKALADTKQQS